MANRAEGVEVPIPTLPYLDDLVERVRRGVLVVEVAMVKAEVRFGIVEVEEAKYLKFKVGAEEEPNLIISESKKAPPLRESFSAGVEVPNPRKSVAVRKVTLLPALVKGEQMSLN
jgi:hypothetical protein